MIVYERLNDVKAVNKGLGIVLNLFFTDKTIVLILSKREAKLIMKKIKEVLINDDSRKL